MNQTAIEQKKEVVSINSEATSIFLPSTFDDAQRMAHALCASSLVPKDYQDNLANALIAMDMAMRLKANVLMVMQNLYIVHGRPGWSSQFLIASFNKQRTFSPIRYEFKGEEGTDDWGCRAYAIDLTNDEKLEGTWITMGMAKQEGWSTKNGSKWKTMPEQMMRYRAAAFFIRTYAPDVSMGLMTQEEIYDIPAIDGEVVNDDLNQSSDTQDLNAQIKQDIEQSKPEKAESEQSEETPEPSVFTAIENAMDEDELLLASDLIRNIKDMDEKKKAEEMLEAKRNELAK